MEKYHIIKAYNGMEIIDSRPEAEDFLYSLERLEKRYNARSKRKNTIQHVLSAVGIL